MAAESGPRGDGGLSQFKTSGAVRRRRSCRRVSEDAPPLKRSVVFANDLLEPLVGLARAAEDAGFHRVWTTEYVGRDAVARALAIGLATKRIGVGTGIAYAFTRPSLAMAGLAGDVQRLLDGRFTLGLGSGTRGVRRWYGVEIDAPATWFAGYVHDLREGWDRAPAPPVYGAGLNPAMVRAVARSSDGLVLHPVAIARPHLRERVLPAVQAGREQRADGAPDAFRVAVWCVTSIDADEELARSNARRQLAFYFSTPSYKPVLEDGPWESVADVVQAAFADARPDVDWRQMEPLIPDEMVDELTLTGTPTGVAARAARLERELGAAGVDELVFQTVGVDLTPEQAERHCEAIIRTLAAPTTVRA
jgi:alkanesulfonate monooxygenase SsuD/methylene tetrahydromethanopterin reductase-like flavin-dependent oxidoreductase (luciferase family)